MKNIMKTTALALVLLLVCMTCGANADDYAFFQAVISGDFPSVGKGIVLIDEALSVSVPSHWEADQPLYEDMLQYRGTGESAGAKLMIAWVDEAERPFEELMAACKEMAVASCKADVSGFEWQAYEVAQGIMVLHKGLNGKTYALGLEYEGNKPAPDSAIARDFHCVIHSFQPADALLLSIFDSQQDSLVPAEEAAQFEDPAFEAMLLKAMGLSADASVRARNLEQITNLMLHRGQMSFHGFSDIEHGAEQQVFEVSLADLKLFPNLERLYVCDMTVTSLETLQHCPQLTELSLIGCELASCDVLASLTQLESLSLARNSIVSLKPLAGLMQLTSLNLYCNPVEDLSVLASMTKLRDLLLSGTNIRTLDGLAGCAALEELTVQDVEGVTLSLKPLAGLEKLTRVDFENTDVCDREGIVRVENVKLGSW